MISGPPDEDDINEAWISDKTRHVVDGLRTQRLDQPYLRENGRLRPASWSEAFAAIAARVERAKAGRVGARLGDLAAVEEIFALKDLMTRLNVTNLDCRQDGSVLDPMGPRDLPVERDHHRDRPRRRAPHFGSNPRRQATVSTPHRLALAHRQSFPSESSAGKRRSPTATTISAPGRNARHYHPAQLWRRHHRFMEQCVPLGKDPNGPTRRSFGTPSDAGGARTNCGSGSRGS